MTHEPISFAAGPAALPKAVIKKVQEGLFNWQNTGVSIFEIGHRTPQFIELGEKLEASVRRILSVPDDFAVLFLPAGGQAQFSFAVMNLVRGFDSANYVETGIWSTIAIKAAQKHVKVHVAASSQSDNFTNIPDVSTWDIQKDAAFLHFTDNETIGGVEFPTVPQIDGMVLVSDMSSNIFSRPIDFNRMGCVYACAQKNLGIAGMSLVIVRRDLLDRALPETPVIFNYANQEKNHSLACTPTTTAWYVASLVLDWVEEQGGLAKMTELSRQKAKLLYDFIDTSELYRNSIELPCRSRMNVPFFLTDTKREADFFQAAKKEGLLYLEGHRTAGGARASIYNAIGLDDVKRLVVFMEAFAA